MGTSPATRNAPRHAPALPHLRDDANERPQVELLASILVAAVPAVQLKVQGLCSGFCLHSRKRAHGGGAARQRRQGAQQQCWRCVARLCHCWQLVQSCWAAEEAPAGLGQSWRRLRCGRAGCSGDRLLRLRSGCQLASAQRLGQAEFGAQSTQHATKPHSRCCQVLDLCRAPRPHRSSAERLNGPIGAAQ